MDGLLDDMRVLYTGAGLACVLVAVAVIVAVRGVKPAGLGLAGYQGPVIVVSGVSGVSR